MSVAVGLEARVFALGLVGTRCRWVRVAACLLHALAPTWRGPLLRRVHEGSLALTCPLVLRSSSEPRMRCYLVSLGAPVVGVSEAGQLVDGQGRQTATFEGCPFSRTDPHRARTGNLVASCAPESVLHTVHTYAISADALDSRASRRPSRARSCPSLAGLAPWSGERDACPGCDGAASRPGPRCEDG